MRVSCDHVKPHHSFFMSLSLVRGDLNQHERRKHGMHQNGSGFQLLLASCVAVHLLYLPPYALSLTYHVLLLSVNSPLLETLKGEVDSSQPLSDILSVSGHATQTP